MSAVQTQFATPNIADLFPNFRKARADLTKVGHRMAANRAEYHELMTTPPEETSSPAEEAGARFLDEGVVRASIVDPVARTRRIQELREEYNVLAAAKNVATRRLQQAKHDTTKAITERLRGEHGAKVRTLFLTFVAFHEAVEDLDGFKTEIQRRGFSYPYPVFNTFNVGAKWDADSKAVGLLRELIETGEVDAQECIDLGYRLSLGGPRIEDEPYHLESFQPIPDDNES